MFKRSHLLVIILLSIGCSSDTSSKYTIVIDDSLVGGISFWKKYLLNYYAEKAIDRVTTYFEISYQDTLHVYMLDNQRYEARRNAIYLDMVGYRKKSAILHEVTHALLKQKESNFEMEGLAVLMECKLINDEKLIKDRYKSYTIYPIQYLIENDQLYSPNTKIGMCVYLQTGLFYLFLDEKYGRNKMLEFYSQGIRRIESVYGVSVDSLDEAWQNWLLE